MQAQYARGVYNYLCKRAIVIGMRMTYEQATKRYENVMRLKKDGASVKEIAQLYGITRQAIEDSIRRGPPRKDSGWSNLLTTHNLSHLQGRERARALVRIRDNFTCQDCGAVRTADEVSSYNKTVKGKTSLGKLKSLDVHHLGGMCGKNSRGYDSLEDVPNMITLCHKCHFNRPEHTTWNEEYRANRKKAREERKLSKI